MSWSYQSDMCIYYNDTKKIDMGNITEVRTGFSTDTLNDIEKRLKQEKKIKIGQCTEDNCFSIIFDPRYSGFLMLNYVNQVQINLRYRHALANWDSNKKYDFIKKSTIFA